MPRPFRRFGRCLPLVVLLATPAAAQDQGGGIQGVVRDASRAVLPGVTIEARSPSMPGVQTAVSGGDGVYRFPILRPGIYEVTAALTVNNLRGDPFYRQPRSPGAGDSPYQSRRTIQFSARYRF